ncbi:glycosyl hydrolase family 43 [Streptomyces sp. 2132.2]|uniref:RICIN domain-containing protein n=1 Tax=Streptomyces sp. 2132.2 TaxID=2485161 RepID=UPI000C191BE2|nr:RICIN domain-containing protein [Streptomyces sp. 2132.2]ROR00269.1 glycosyl hydrolase family 43 [Streptomyces sp. 2132.2]
MRRHPPSPAALFAVLATLFASLLGGLGTAAASPSPVTVVNATQFTDPAGLPVHAHGGGVIKVDEYYYWFGEDRNPDNSFRYVSAYRSADLRTWEFRGHVLSQATDPELATANIERPKVMYNRATGQFVMWMHKEGSATDYGEARAAVAVSSTVDGDYSWRGSFRPLGHMSRDITTFVDTDGTGYMVSAANENADLHVYRLTADYTGIEARVQKLWAGQSREAPALFKRDGVYFLVTSGATGWSPNQQKYGTADSITGTWSPLRDLGDGRTYGSQTAFVLPVEGTSGVTTHLYMGDRWGNSMGGTVNDSQYIWLPLKFPTRTTLSMDYYPQIIISTENGTVRGIGDWNTLTAAHSGKCADAADWSVAEGAPLIQWTCATGSVNQQVWFQGVGDGTVRIMLRHSGKCLAVQDASPDDGAGVVQTTCGAGPGQTWKSAQAGPTGMRLVAQHSGKCLDVANSSWSDGARLVQWTCNGGDNQKWRRSAV